MQKELEVLQVERKIRRRVKKQMEKSQREYYLNEQMKAIQEELGDKAVKDFLMIERHYFNEKLIKSFEFKFDFCIPNSVNTWESIYTIPEIDPEIKKQMIDEPWHTRSDSFYFVGEKLIIHNKAIYNYAPLN